MDEKELHDEMIAALADFQKEKEAREHRPDQVEICCVILALIVIILLTVAGLALWATPTPLLPTLGKAAANSFADLFRKEE